MSFKDNSLWDYASRLIEILQRELRLDLPPGFAKVFLWHAKKVGSSNYEDLGSLLLLECLEARNKGVTLDAKEVVKALDRVRHRVAREIRREATAATSRLKNKPDRDASLEHHQAMSKVSAAISELSPLELSLFERHYMTREEVSQTARECGISRATLYRKLRRIEKMITDSIRK